MEWNVSLVLRIAFAFQLVARIHAPQPDFDFFYFVLQWPGSRSFGRDPCCYPPDGKPMGDFLIHGLWPQRLNGDMPRYCTSEQFDGKLVQPIRPELNKYWPSLSCPRSGSTAQNPSFWEHEWEKHGTCSKWNQLAYFQSALCYRHLIQNKAKFLASLRDNGIVPSDTGVVYDRAKIKHVLNDALWSAFVERHDDAPFRTNAPRTSGSNRSSDPDAVSIKCEYDTFDPTHYQLSEIWICIDRKSTFPIPCPVASRDICLQNISFHTFRDCDGLVPKISPRSWWPYVSHVCLIFLGCFLLLSKWRCTLLRQTISLFSTLIVNKVYSIHSRDF